jgi:hypothetical protein
MRSYGLFLPEGTLTCKDVKFPEIFGKGNRKEIGKRGKY